MLKEKILYIHDIIGIPYTMIARKAGISSSLLNLWLKGKRNLSEETYDRLEAYYEKLQVEVEKI